jgi:hypothetical protein
VKDEEFLDQQNYCRLISNDSVARRQTFEYFSFNYLVRSM